MGRVEAAANRIKIRRYVSEIARVIHVNFQSKKREQIVSIGGSEPFSGAPEMVQSPLNSEIADVIRLPRPEITEVQGTEIEEKSIFYNPVQEEPTEISQFRRRRQEQTEISINIPKEVAGEQEYHPGQRNREDTEAYVRTFRRPRRPSRCLADRPHTRKKCRGGAHKRSDDPPEDDSTNQRGRLASTGNNEVGGRSLNLRRSKQSSHRRRKRRSLLIT